MGWTLCLLLASFSATADEPEPQYSPVVREALAALDASDSFAAYGLIEAQPDLAQVGQAYLDLAMALYWDRKDLPAAVETATVGSAYTLSAAKRAEGSDPKLAALGQRIAMLLTYNLASFIWPGWAEPGVSPSPGDVTRGLDAAKAHVRIAEGLGVGDLERSRAHWVLGAQWLAAGDYAAAHTEFLGAADLARAAAEAIEALNAVACARLAYRLQHANSAAAREAFAQALKALDEAEANDFFTQQVRRCERVFAGF
jgi:hypothetical protein